MTAVEVVKLLGTSEQSWEAAAREAFERASQTVDDIQGMEIESWAVDVVDGEIAEYRATVELAFPVHKVDGLASPSSPAPSIAAWPRRAPHRPP